MMMLLTIWWITVILMMDDNKKKVYVFGDEGLNKKTKGEKGSMTLETSIVFCAVFFCIVAVIYICLLIYHQTCNEALAERTSRKVASTWNNLYEDMFIKKKTTQELSKNQLYEEFVDEEIDKKRLKAVKYIAFYHDPFKVLKSYNSGIEMRIQNSIVNRKIEICINEQYKLPVGQIFNIVGLNNIFGFSAKSESVINEPTEFINNTDFLVETCNEIDRKYLNGKTNETLEEIGKKFNDIFEKAKKYTQTNK